MEKMLNWFTQKKMFLISIVGVCGFYLFWNMHIKGVCVPVNIYSGETMCELTSTSSMIFLATLFFSVLFFLIKSKPVYDSWKKFTLIYLFIYLFIVFITPWRIGQTQGFFAGPVIEKSFIALLLTILYSIISVALIIYKSFKKKS